jgi:hypothetical protein
MVGLSWVGVEAATRVPSSGRALSPECEVHGTHIDVLTMPIVCEIV